MQAVFEYNQKNFKYDREMRQKTEFKTREWRNAQCDLWRDDVREIIGLTERKMDSYLVIGTLQLGMSVVLFCEGRLEPGTPPWLMHMYMMSTVGAFMYLLMAVWLAMHASIVAQCSEVRLLTQYVRRPIPTWEELQDMRTFAQTYEHLESQQVMRVPFTGSAKPDQDHATGATTSSFGAPFGSSKPSSTVGALPSAEAAERAIDPWFKEANAEDRQGLYELMQMPIERRRHIYLARRSAAQYQAFDAFTRTALSCGTHQLLSAVAYYCIGYCSIQDGAPWPAFCVAFVMVAASVSIAQLDFSMTRREQDLARVLLVTGPLLSATMAWARAAVSWCTYLVYIAFPLATMAHAGWLLFSLRALDVQKQENGSYLPMKFRAVLYLDVFGWFRKGGRERSAASPASKRSMDYSQLQPSDSTTRYNSVVAEFQVVPQAEEESGSEDSAALSELQENIREDICMWHDEKVWPHLDEEERKKVKGFAETYRRITGEAICDPSKGGFLSARPTGARTWLKMSGYADTGREAPYLFQPETGEVVHLPEVSREAGDAHSVNSEDFFEGDPPEDVRSMSMVEQDLEELQEIGAERYGAWSGHRTQAKRKPQGKHFEVGSKEVIEYLVGEEDSSGTEDIEDPVIKKEVRKRRQGMESYCPGGRRALHPEHNKLHAEPDEDILVGYGDLKPGVIPWQIFRVATKVLAFCWVFGSCAPLAVRRDMLVKSMKLIGGEMGVSDNDPLEREVTHEAERKQQREHLRTLDILPGGQLVQTYWPSHSGFEPRALSCDPLGAKIVVADDFGIYAAELQSDVADSDDMQLRGASSKGSKLLAHFYPQPHCAAIEGHGLQDVSVACVGGQNHSKHCRVLVLHQHGGLLSECDLKLDSPLGPAKHVKARHRDPGEREALPSWGITTTWLRGDDEYVTSAAVSSKCLKPIVRLLAPQEEVEEVTGEFKPQIMAGECVIVGTSVGRIIELRTHYFNHTQLVPEKAMREWLDPVTQGALHILNNGVVVAIENRISVHALDLTSGKSIGEWRLPHEDVEWRHICGGGASLFILGSRKGEARLYRFQMPKSVQEWRGDEDQGSALHRKLEI